MRFVSLDQAKLRLKVDNDQQDSDIELMIAGASKACFRYMGEIGTSTFTDSAGTVMEDSNGVVIGVPEDAQNACLVLVGMWLRDPSGVEAGSWERGYLPAPVTALLYPFRRPSMS